MTMRKTQYGKALEAIRFLANSAEEIKKDLSQSDITNVMDRLIKCQEKAIELGMMIEASEGEGFVTVSYLEEYCEMIYQVYEGIHQNNALSPNNIYKKLNKGIIKIENSIKNDVKIRKEAVFLPYKASMWDSLESIWMAANDDPDCEAFVIPIPYFDKNPDGSFKEMHYEGDQYPKYVPITKYNEFDFETHHPDMIFIHNCYDEYNLVTSVHPFFFTMNLRKFTDQLIYVPYFLLGEIKPDEKEKIEGMKHFCTTPGVVNSDYVVVQSPDMRQIYIDVLCEQFGVSTRLLWEKKILGLGSPKVDKVLNTKKEDLIIPEEWLKIIQKPDGSWKKIIFYNTSITALLKYGNKILDKMRGVFKTFKENKDEVALLWRPHPLIRATVASMRPQLWDEYNKMVAQYKEEGWGIYDDTADMDRAVVLSDAYYGDGSSVVQLCLKAGKQVVLQNICYRNESGKTVCIEDGVMVEEVFWFVVSEVGALFSYNFTNNQVDCFVLRGMEDFLKIYGAFRTVEYVNGTLYLIPFNAEDIVIVNLKNMDMELVKIDGRFKCKEGKNFMASFVKDDYIYLFGVSQPVILKLNTCDNSIEYITLTKEQIIQENKNKDDYFGKQVVYKDGYIFVPFCNIQAVLKLECDTMEYQIIKLGNNDSGYSGICYSDGEFWLSPRRNENLAIWNEDNDFIRYIASQCKNDELSYIGIENISNKIMLFPIKNREKSFLETNEIEEANGEYSFVRNDGEKIFYYEFEEGKLTIIADNKKDERKIRVSRDIFCHYKLDTKQISFENALFDLIDLFSGHNVAEKTALSRQVGKEIYIQLKC